MTFMKVWFTLIFGKNIVQRWDSLDSEFQIFIIGAIFFGIFLLILFYVIIPTIKFFFNSEFNKEIKSNWGRFFSSFKPETIKNYISGSLPKSERNAFIVRWTVSSIVFMLIMSLFSIGIINPFVFYLVLGILLVGFLTSLLKKNNIKFNIPNREKKNNFETNVKDRLSILKDLLDKGVIDRQEYEKQREKIISDI